MWWSRKRAPRPTRQRRHDSVEGWCSTRRLLAAQRVGLACFVFFAVFLFAQSLTGWRTAVADAVQHGGSSFTYWKYLTTGHFAEATFENWESEFLQMGAFVLLTVFFLQKGSGESKQEHDDPRDEDPRDHRDDPDAPWPVRRGGAWLTVYENSLLIAFAVLFLGSFVGHAVAGAHEYSAEQHEHGAPASARGSSSARRSSGSSRSRTGRASSSPSARSSCSRSSSANAAPPNPNRSTPRTARPATTELDHAADTPMLHRPRTGVSAPAHVGLARGGWPGRLRCGRHGRHRRC